MDYIAKTTLRVFSWEFPKFFKTTTLFASFWHFIFENHLIKWYFLCAHTVFSVQFSLSSYSVEMFSIQVQKVFHVQKLFAIRRSSPQEVLYIKSNKNLPKPAVFLKKLCGRCLLENYPKNFTAVISLNTCEQLLLNLTGKNVFASLKEFQRHQRACSLDLSRNQVFCKFLRNSGFLQNGADF